MRKLVIWMVAGPVIWPLLYSIKYLGPLADGDHRRCGFHVGPLA
jgi:hypothetical protein